MKELLARATAKNSAKIFDVPSLSDASTYSNYISLNCGVNQVSNSGDLGSYTGTGALSACSSYVTNITEAVNNFPLLLTLALTM